MEAETNQASELERKSDGVCLMEGNTLGGGVMIMGSGFGMTE